MYGFFMALLVVLLGFLAACVAITLFQKLLYWIVDDWFSFSSIEKNLTTNILLTMIAALILVHIVQFQYK
jgi:hypothetical protein